MGRLRNESRTPLMGFGLTMIDTGVTRLRGMHVNTGEVWHYGVELNCICLIPLKSIYVAVNTTEVRVDIVAFKSFVLIGVITVACFFDR